MSPYAYEYDLFLHMVFRILKPHKNRKTPKQHNSSYIRFQRNHQYNYVRPDDSVNNTNKQKKTHTQLFPRPSSLTVMLAASSPSPPIWPQQLSAQGAGCLASQANTNRMRHVPIASVYSLCHSFYTNESNTCTTQQEQTKKRTRKMH